MRRLLKTLTTLLAIVFLLKPWSLVDAVSTKKKFDRSGFQVMSFNLQYRSKGLSPTIPADPDREARLTDFLFQLGGCRKSVGQNEEEHFNSLRSGTNVCPLGYTPDQNSDSQEGLAEGLQRTRLMSDELLDPFVMLIQEDTGEGVAGFTRVASCESEITKDQKRQRTSIYLRTDMLPANTIHEDHSITFFAKQGHRKFTVVGSAEVTEKLEVPYDAYEHSQIDADFTTNPGALWTVRCAAIAFITIDMGNGKYQPLLLASAHLSGGRLDDELLRNGVPKECRGSPASGGSCDLEASLYHIKKDELLAIEAHMDSILDQKGVSVEKRRHFPRILGGDMNSFPGIQVEAAQGDYYHAKLSKVVNQDLWLEYQTVPDRIGTMGRVKFKEEAACSVPNGMSPSCLNEASTTDKGGKVDHFFTNPAVTVDPHSLTILHNVGMEVLKDSTVKRFEAKKVLSDHAPIVMKVRLNSKAIGDGTQGYLHSAVMALNRGSLAVIIVFTVLVAMLLSIIFVCLHRWRSKTVRSRDDLKLSTIELVAR